MNVTYRTNFIMRMGIPLFLFGVYFFSSHSTKFALVLAILGIIQTISFGVDIHKKGNWNKINLQHDQRTKQNALFSGYIMYWATILVLFVGAILIEKSIIAITYLDLIGYSILISLIARMIIRDYLNNREESED